MEGSTAQGNNSKMKHFKAAWFLDLNVVLDETSLWKSRFFFHTACMDEARILLYEICINSEIFYLPRDLLFQLYYIGEPMFYFKSSDVLFAKRHCTYMSENIE